ncbi:MAG: hypothetical protein U9R75_01505 [Candidatus Thermoplasmatota archaeon]|nr:hypothetical protein [Candidatus Thermoplasmatota archaeon]
MGSSGTLSSMEGQKREVLPDVPSRGSCTSRIFSLYGLARKWRSKTP